MVPEEVWDASHRSGNIEAAIGFASPRAMGPKAKWISARTSTARFFVPLCDPAVFAAVTVDPELKRLRGRMALTSLQSSSASSSAAMSLRHTERCS
jgi:hypothetical protein